MKHVSQGPIVASIFKKIAPRIGAKVVLEPEWGIAGQILYKSGRKRYFRYSSLDLNTLGASEIAKDKDYANYFMKKLGYPTLPGKTFFSLSWAKTIDSKRTTKEAVRYAERMGFPVIAKPNSGSQGNGVALCHTKDELRQALARIFKFDHVALVQQQVIGNDYRIVVLDDQVISAYERAPLVIVGDGVRTVRKLLLAKQKEFVASSRDTRLKLQDPRMEAKIRREKLRMDSIPAEGRRVFLLDNANLSSGGDAVDVTHLIHKKFKSLAIALTKDMGLRLCGVDIMVEGDIQNGDARCSILEINSAPGLDHYVKTGRAQQKIVEDMYLEVLKHMDA